MTKAEPLRTIPALYRILWRVSDPGRISLPEPLEYLPLRAGPFRLAMGLKDLRLDDWIEIDRHYPEQLALKRRLFDERREEVFAALPGSETASREVLDLLIEHLCCRFPDWFERRDRTLTNRITAETWATDASPLHPLELASRLVQEDLCLMQRRQDRYVLSAACVCFPSRWTLAEKMGRPLRGIHEPVPGYELTLATPADRFFEVITPDRPAWRLNWTIHEQPDLFQPTAPVPPLEILTPENAGERLWFRVERQTLRRLPASGDILFTIRTYVSRVAEVARDAKTAAQLAESLGHWPEEVVGYKGGRWLDAALNWLRAQAQKKQDANAEQGPSV